MNNKYNYILIDVSSLFHNLYFNNKKYEKEQPQKFQPLIKNVNGTPTYTSTLRSYIRKIYELRKVYPNSEIIHVLDPLDSKDNFRKTIDPNYKSQRSEKDQELIIQLAMLPKLLNYLGEANVSHNNYEADDLIGTLIKQMSQDNNNVLVYSKDKDLLQLMFDENKIHFLREFYFNKNECQQTIIDSFAKVKEKMEVHPLLIPESLAIAGDNADNIIGINGLGVKKTGDLLNKYGNFFELVKNIDELPEKLKQIFAEQNNIDLVLKNIKLTTINTEVPIENYENILSNAKKLETEQGYKVISNLLNINIPTLKEIKIKNLSYDIDKEMQKTITQTMNYK